MYSDGVLLQPVDDDGSGGGPTVTRDGIVNFGRVVDRRGGRCVVSQCQSVCAIGNGATASHSAAGQTDSAGTRRVNHGTVHMPNGGWVYGDYNKITGSLVAVIGNHNQVNNVNGAVIQGDYNTVSGDNVTVTGNHDDIHGDNVTASGDYNHIFGDNVTTTGNHVEIRGDNGTATGDYVTITGDNGTATGSHCHVSGRNAVCTGSYSTRSTPYDRPAAVPRTPAASSLVFGKGASGRRVSGSDIMVESASTTVFGKGATMSGCQIIPGPVVGNPTFVVRGAAPDTDLLPLTEIPADEPATAGSECVVCMENKKVLAPAECGHLILCGRCAKVMIDKKDSDFKCPICKVVVRRKLMRIFA